MILIQTFLIFSAIFTILYYDTTSNFEEDHTTALLKSIAMNAKIFGPLPQKEQNKMPWITIGIASTFFKQDNEYNPSSAYTNEKLISVDHVNWIFSNFITFVPSPAKGINICMLDGLAFRLNNIEYSRDTLLAYAHYNAKYHNMPVPKEDYNNITIYPNMEATVLGYIC